MVSLTRASELVRRLERTKRFPSEDSGVENLARGLQHASEVAKVGAGRIIERCAEISEWCPSDAELLTVARDIAREDSVVAGTFDSTAGLGNATAIDTAQLKRQYGDPVPFDWRSLDMAKVKSVKGREKKMLAEIRAKYPGEIGWPGMIAAARELGYKDYADAWERGMR